MAIFRSRESATTALAGARATAGTSGTGFGTGELARLIEHLHFELIPTPKVALQFAHLPPHSTVSVTCSPAKDIEATLALSAELIDQGHRVIPHLAARMVEGPDHVAAISAWLREHDQTEVFVIGGDAPTPHGPYHDAAGFIAALLQFDTPLQSVGFGGYPDGHATIPSDQLMSALLAKQQLLDDAGVTGWVSTQMCFDTKAIVKWTKVTRAAGLHLPIHLGIPGVIDTTKLLTMGAKLGIGASLRYLRKNRAVVSKLAAPGGYDPMQLLTPLAPSFDALGIEALHVFTFNQVANTAAWRSAALGETVSSIAEIVPTASHLPTAPICEGSLQHGISI